jgi:hypothetical protein
MRQVCDGEVEHFADFAAEITRRVGLLRNGQTLLLDGVEQGNIGAKAGAHAGLGSRRESVMYRGAPRPETAHTNDGFSFRRVVQRDGWRNIR